MMRVMGTELLVVPLVPVTVMLKVPRGELFRVEIVSVEEVPVVELGENDAVTRDGTPVREKFTLPVNPPIREIEMAYVVEFLRTTVLLVGVELMVNPCAAVMVSVTVVEWVRAPLVPVIVSVYEPKAAVPVFTVNVELPVVGLGLKLALAPDGTPVTLNVTDPVNPLSGVSVAV
jgi:hypothetical protein